MQWLLTSTYGVITSITAAAGMFGRPVKSFPVQRDEHLLMVLRYVLQNPARSGLAASIGDWPWSSCCRNELADPCPVEVETDWLAQCGRTVISEPIGFYSSVSESSKTFWRTRLADDDCRFIWT